MRKEHWRWVVLLAAAWAGCGAPPRQPVFEDERHGLRFVPPPGWSERTRGDDPAPAGERLLVRYKRLRAGAPAWLCVTAADVPRSTTLAACLEGHAPRGNWRRAEA